MNKKISVAIAIILISTIFAQTALIQTAFAHSPPWEIPSFGYVEAKPNPVGVGQRVMIFMWVDTPLPSAAVTNDIRRHDYTLTITKPDGAKETQQWPVIEDTTGIQFYTYTPTQVGKYSLLFEYKGQIFTWNETAALRTWTDDKFLPTTATATLTVQEEPLPDPITSYPLPTEYWTRPIEGQNTDWHLISSNWLNGPGIRTGDTSTGGAGYSRFQPDGIGPNSAHIMWSKPIQDGGVVGGSGFDVPGKTYYMGGSYNTRFANAIVMYGRLYYTESYGNSGGGGDLVCVNLRTGEELWRTNTTGIGVPTFGYLYSFDTGNQHGVLPEGLLFTNNFARSYDPSTGIPTTMNITGVPSGTAVVGPQGEILRYTLNSAGKWLAQWNSSKVFGASAGTAVGTWYSGTADASLASRYDWNITIPSLGAGTWSIFRDVVFDKVMLLVQGNLGTGPRAVGQGANITAISLKPGSIGQVMWARYYPEAPNNVTRVLIAIDADAGTFVTEDKETLTLTGFSLTDGRQVWTSTPDHPLWDTMRCVSLAAYGNLYRSGFDGVLYCYDMATGKVEWTYGNGGPGNSTYAGLGTSYGHYPIFVDVIADGKVYIGTTEHSPDSPWFKDVRYRCVDAFTGEELWTLMGWGTGMYVGQNDIVADGFFVFLNCYDMQIYCVGKGPSALSVTAPDIAASFGTPVVIKGTVTDISAGTKQEVQVARFPNGVPAVSDDSMGAWMEYVYMQKPRPTDTTGVPITIDVIDANGNYRNIGMTTSDEFGKFSLTWTPDIEGDYTVIARFTGSESYWPSYDKTSFTVDLPQATASPLPQIALPPTELYFAISTAAIVAAIAIVGAILLLALKKRA